jgi:hypothetical protein
MKPISRRTILRGAAGAAIPLPLLELMGRPRAARAATISKTGPNGAPKRFLMFFTPCGQGPDFLHCTNDASGNLVLAPSLKPMDRHASKLLVFTGVNNQAALHDPADIDPGHQKPSVTVSTAVESNGGDGAAASIDQTIAKAISAGTKLPSIELAVGTRQSMSWGGAKVRLPAIDDPAQAFTKLFSDVSTNQTALARINAERKSILDGVKQDYAALIARMGADDKRRLSSHLDGIRDIETRLDATSVACTPGQAPASTRDFIPTGDLHMGLLATALACDVTRVGSLTYQGQGGNILLPGFPKGIHDASHDYGSAGWPTRNKYTEWFSGRFAMLLDKLAAVDEGGRSVLDNTVVFWFSEHGCGNHNYDMMPVVVAGSGGGYFKTGRQMTFANGTDGLNYVQYNAGADKATGPAQSDLFVSFLNAMGVEATTFGDPKLCKGPLAGMTG